MQSEYVLEGLVRIKQIEELIEIVGKGNLLEALFIFLGNVQHVDLERCMDYRNHLGLSAFIKKTEEPLDEYFNLMFSLQGLFLIYVQAYKTLAENDQLSTQEVIDEIYEVVSSSHIGEQLDGVINHGQLTENERKLKLLNILASPKSEILFNNNSDFEDQVLKDIKELLEAKYTNKPNRSCALIKCVINYYYTIHQNIKVDKDVALLLSLLLSLNGNGNYEKLLSSNTVIKKEVLKINEDQLIFAYITCLTQILQNIELPSENGTKYELNRDGIRHLNVTFEEMLKDHDNEKGFLYPINIKSTLEQLLKNQNSDEFEKRVTDPKNIYYSAPQKDNIHSDKKKKEEKHTEYKNTACKLILGVFVLSIGLCVVDYFLMKQKLLQPVKNILPQDNLTNLIIAAVLTIIIVSALFQLLKPQPEPPKPKIAEVLVTNEKLESCGTSR